MDNSYYRFPIDPTLFMNGQENTPVCSAAESIANNLMLLITTRRGENRFDDEYGNDVWDVEFDNAVTAVEWENIFAESLKRQIALYEPRIIHPRVKIRIEYVEHSYKTRKYSEMKRKAKIAVNARLADTGEFFRFSTALYLSPMSID